MNLAALMPKTKVAICLSGQPRTWRKVVDTWSNIARPETNVQVDYFMHMWDENSYHSKLGDEKKKVSEEEIQELIARIQPKKYVVETARDFTGLDTSRPEHSAYQSQFYSIMRSARLKKDYEIEQNILYDVVIKSRFDNFIGANNFNPFVRLKERTMYGMHFRYDDEKNKFRIGDIFFYADSLTFDIICEFYYDMVKYPSEWFVNTPPEFAFHWYVKNNNITIQQVWPEVKLMRPSKDYLEAENSNYELF
jgi:hypothetical protein